MAEDMHPLRENPFGESPEGLIPAVDPADLRSVWKMQREVQERAPGGHAAILSDELYKRACSPGANIGAVWFRTAMLGMLEMFGMLAAWIQEGVIADAVFQVAATFPMKGIAIGTPREGFPFDVQEFLSQVAKR
jgi:hypothetical protein